MSGERNYTETCQKTSPLFFAHVKKHIPITVVDLGLCTQQFSFAGLVSEVTTDLVAVFFCLQHGNQVDAGPHLFAGEFAAQRKKSVLAMVILSCFGLLCALWSVFDSRVL